MEENDLILKMVGICKSFPGVKALDNVNFEVKRGHIHGLIGENGAGKSTLMKILSGVYHQDEGEIYFDGKHIPSLNPSLSCQIGISITYQEFNLVPILSVAENIYINRMGESGKNKKFVNWQEINKKAVELLKRIGYELNVKQLVQELGAAQMQMVEIAKALSYNAQLIIMDEPTAPLTKNELEKFFDVITTLKQQGITIVFISHKLDELFQICDEITVMRDGKMIDTKIVSETNKEEVIRKMIGREMTQEFPDHTSNIGEVIMQVRNLNIRGKIIDVNFDIHRGEILGLVGLVGAGRSETVRGIFGAEQHSKCEIKLKGQRKKITSPAKAIASKIILLPEDRKQDGLFLSYDIKSNITAANLNGIRKGMLLSKKLERLASQKMIKDLNIKTPSEDQKVINLSGGNQQKVVVAKALFANPDILIMDEPTRGIDVGAKYEIYQIMNKLVEQGKSIIFISSELAEVFGMSDRVLVIYNKKIRGEFKRDDFKDTQNIMRYVLGQADQMQDSKLNQEVNDNV